VIFQLAQLALAIFFAGRFEVSRFYEGSNAAPGLDNAGAFEFGVHLCDGVGIDSQVYGELSHGWQLIAHAKLAGCNRAAVQIRALSAIWRFGIYRFCSAKFRVQAEASAALLFHPMSDNARVCRVA